MIRQADLTSRASTLPSPALSDNEALSEDDEEHGEDGGEGSGELDLGNVWELLKYRPGPPAIKVSLGLVRVLFYCPNSLLVLM